MRVARLLLPFYGFSVRLMWFYFSTIAITSSAKKAYRASLRKRVFNLRRSQAVEQIVKKIKKLVTEKKFDEAKKLIPQAYKAYDKAAKEHTIKKGAADRKKSRLTILVQKQA